MEPKTFSYDSATGLGKIHAREYPLSSPRAVVLICHGMFEHFGRYDAFAKFLQGSGFAVIGFDMAGHGLSTPDAPRGFFGEKGGWVLLMEDIHMLRTSLCKEYPGVPIFLFGHSMGAALVQAYCARYGQGLSGAIVMGCSGIRRIKPLLGLFLTQLLPKKKPSMFFRGITFQGFNKTYPKPVDTFSWLSQDVEVIQKYKSDPLRIETFTARGYYDLGALTAYNSKPAWFKAVPKELPMLFVSGKDDPVSLYGKGAEQVAARLKEEGAKDLSVKVYAGARHELLNEPHNDEVMKDILDWLNGHIKE